MDTLFPYTTLSRIQTEPQSEAKSNSNSFEPPFRRRMQRGPIIYVNSHHNESIDVAAYVGADIGEPVFMRLDDAAIQEGPRAALPSGILQPGADKVKIGRASCRERVCQYV